MEIGVDVLETDVHLTRDGVVVVSHDEDGVRSAGVDRRIRECTLEEVRTWDIGRGFEGAAFVGQGLTVLTLSELLAAFPTAHFNIDLKPEDPAVVPPFLSVLAEHDALERVTLASFHTAVIQAVRKRFAGPTVLAQREVLALVGLPLFALRRLGVAGTAVQIPIKAGPIELASRQFIDKCHALGLRVDFWTINDPVVAEILLDRGADGLITDDPARLRPLFDERR